MPSGVGGSASAGCLPFAFSAMKLNWGHLAELAIEYRTRAGFIPYARNARIHAPIELAQRSAAARMQFRNRAMRGWVKR